MPHVEKQAETELTTSPRLLVNSREAAAILSLSDRSFREMAYRGRVPSVRVGRRRLFRLSDLERWAATLPNA